MVPKNRLWMIQDVSSLIRGGKRQSDTSRHFDGAKKQIVDDPLSGPSELGFLRTPHIPTRRRIGIGFY